MDVDEFLNGGFMNGGMSSGSDEDGSDEGSEGGSGSDDGEGDFDDASDLELDGSDLEAAAGGSEGVALRLMPLYRACRWTAARPAASVAVAACIAWFTRPCLACSICIWTVVLFAATAACSGLFRCALIV